MVKNYPEMSQYNFEIIISSLNCPYHKEGLTPNGDFGRYWCKHPEWTESRMECCKEICPILKNSVYRIHFPTNKEGDMKNESKNCSRNK